MTIPAINCSLRIRQPWAWLSTAGIRVACWVAGLAIRGAHWWAGWCIRRGAKVEVLP